MALENATTYAELQDSDPKKTDPKNQGDDHLRMLKRVHKTMWPGIGGDGYAIPIQALEQDLNNLTGTTGNIQEQITAIEGEGGDLDVRITNNTNNITTNTNNITALEEEVALNGGRIYDLEQAIGINVAGVFNGVTGGSAGAGYSVHKNSTGFYTITMSPAPIGAYSVVCSANGITAVDITSLSTFNIVVTDDQINPIDLSDISFQVVFL